MATARATELRAACVEAQAAQTAITSTVPARRDLRGNFICGSGVWVVQPDVFVSVPNFELCPENDRRAILHSARVLCRYVRSLINLRADDLGPVHELVDVAGFCRLPGHSVYDVLDAVPAAETVHAARARDCLALGAVIHVKTRHGSQDVGDEIGTDALNLFGIEEVSSAGILPLIESDFVEAPLTARRDDDRLDNRHILRQLDRHLLWLVRGEVHPHRRGAEPEMARQKNPAAGREIAQRELALFVRQNDYVGPHDLYSATRVRRASLEHDTSRHHRIANLRSGIGAREQQSAGEQLRIRVPDRNRNLGGNRAATFCLQRGLQGIRKAANTELPGCVSAVVQQARGAVHAGLLGDFDLGPRERDFRAGDWLERFRIGHMTDYRGGSLRPWSNRARASNYRGRGWDGQEHRRRAVGTDVK